jgi:hypothetical protein
MGTLNIETNSIDVIKKLALQLPDSRWAVWQSVPREGGKVGKIPHKLSASKLIKIGHDDPSQWVDFDTAAQA